MSGWTGEELRRIGGAEELRLASRRPDGSLRPFTTMWAGPAAHAVTIRLIRATQQADAHG